MKTRPSRQFHAEDVHLEVEAVREEPLAARIIDGATFHAVIRDLARAAEPDGVFCYTFFKGVAAKPRSIP